MKKRLFGLEINCWICAALGGAALFFQLFGILIPEGRQETLTQTHTCEEIDTLFTFNRTTQYNPSKRQTDSRPLETADQSWIDLDSLQKQQIRWCAVSRDMLKKYGGVYEYGDTLDLVFQKNPQLDGKWIIHDTMNRRYKKTIDLLVHKDNKIRLHRRGNATIINKTVITWQN